MKKKLLLVTISTFLMVVITFGQSPNSFKYQAVLRDASGNIRASANTNVRIDILQGSTSGTIVYAETFAAQTNTYGLINLEIGKGTVITGNMALIDWSAGPYFIKISVDGIDTGTTQLLSVPYALFAARAGESDPKIGTNTTNYIPKWDGSKMISSSIFDNGKVGIENSTPAFKLDVKGSINVPVDSGYRINKKVVLSTKGSLNVFVGTYAGYSNTGNSNNFVGYQAGNANVGGNYNNFIGYEAGYSNTTGGGNTFIGRYAGYSNSTNFWNTFLGDRAGYHNTSDRNVFVGADAGYNNISGSYNCYVGLGAGFSNSAGSYGSYMGYNAGYNTTANYNNFIGYMAGFTNTSGMGNCFFGRLAGYVSNGAWNTFIGDRAGTNSTTGVQNVFLGSDNGLGNTTGSYNTALGSIAGQTNMTGNSNTFVGNSSDASSSALSNSTALGYGSIVNASNKVRIGNSSVTVIEGQVAFTSASDIRLKKNIRDISYGIDFIMKIRPVEFQMKQGDDRINFGFIAQDIEKLIGTNNSVLTIGGDKDRTLGLRYTDFISPMVKAIQEQQKQIEDQQKQIEELKRIVNELKKN